MEKKLIPDTWKVFKCFDLHQVCLTTISCSVKAEQWYHGVSFLIVWPLKLHQQYHENWSILPNVAHGRRKQSSAQKMNPIKVIARFNHFSLLLPWTSTITIVTTLISYLPTPLLVHGTHSTPSSGYSLSFDCPASPSLISNFHAVFPKCLMTNILLTLALTSSGASLLTSGFFSGAFIFHTTRGGVSCWTWSFKSEIVL